MANRRVLTAAAMCLAIGGVVVLAGASGRGGATDDVLAPSVTSGELRRMFASEEAARAFRVVGTPVPLLPAEGPVAYHATMLLPRERLLASPAVWAAGVVAARIDAEANFAPLGLTAGTNYLWIDARGPAANPWRGIMISADGNHRTLLPGFKYTPGAEHSDLTSPLGHARQYCGGQLGCLLTKDLPTGRATTVWVACTGGCCELEN